MRRIGNTIAVTMEELTRCDDGEVVMTRSCYDKLIQRKRVRSISRGGGYSKVAELDYDSLPLPYREKFEAKYGNPADILTQSDESMITINSEARRYYAGLEPNTYRLPNGETLPDTAVEEYTINASVLDALVEMYNGQRVKRSQLGNRRPIMWDNIYAACESMRNDVHHTLPANTARLKDKLRTYMQEGFDCLISRKFGNINTTKITDEAGRQIVALRRCRVPVYTFDQMFIKFNEIALSKGWKPLRSVNAMKQYLNKPKVQPLWWDAVYGELAAKQKFERKQRTLLPEVRDALWYGDGTKLNLYYRGIDKNGKLAKLTTSVYEVIDAYSEMLLGYYISSSENFNAQRRAFRMAVETAGHKPFEIVVDNQAGQKTKPAQLFMSKICRVSRFTAPHTPQAKSIEAVFGRFQSQVLKPDWRFTGQNITSKRDSSRPNLEFIEDNAEGLYTYDELCEAYAAYRERWNDAPHPATGISRREMYMQSINSQTPAVSAVDEMNMFWVETELPSTFTGSGITIEVDTRKYTYEVFDESGMPDMQFRAKNTGRKFYVKYDPDDMTMVRLCEKNATGTRVIAEAHPYAVIHRAIQEQTEAEMDFIRSTIEVNKDERIRRQQVNYQIELEHGVAPEQHGLRSPKPRGLSRRDYERLLDKHLHADVEPAPQEEISCEPVAIGVVNKQISNITFDNKSILSKF